LGIEPSWKMVGDDDGGLSRAGSLNSDFRRDEGPVDARAVCDPTTVEVDTGVSKRLFFVSGIGVEWSSWSSWSQWALVVPLKSAFGVGDP